MWHIWKRTLYAERRLRKKIAATIKALRIKGSPIYSILDFEVLTQIQTVSVSRIGCTYLSPVWEVKRREREIRVSSAMLAGGDKVFG